MENYVSEESVEDNLKERRKKIESKSRSRVLKSISTAIFFKLIITLNLKNKYGAFSSYCALGLTKGPHIGLIFILHSSYICLIFMSYLNNICAIFCPIFLPYLMASYYGQSMR